MLTGNTIAELVTAASRARLIMICRVRRCASLPDLRYNGRIRKVALPQIEWVDSIVGPNSFGQRACYDCADGTEENIFLIARHVVATRCERIPNGTVSG